MKAPPADWMKKQSVRVCVGVLGAFALLLFMLGPRGLARLRLAVFVARLPESVVLVRHIPAHESSDRLWTLAKRLFSLGPTPSAWNDETSSLVLYVRKGESLVPLRFASSSSEASETSWSHATLNRDPETMTVIRENLRRMPSLGDIRLIFRLLREQQHFVLFHPSFLATIHPVFAGGSTTSWDAVTWTADRQEVRFRMLHFGDASFLTGTHGQLPPLILPPPLALDGLRLEQILPVDLPPTLHILREVTGVAEELRGMQKAFAQRPIAFLLVEEDQHLRPLLIIALESGDMASARERIRVLFRARLRLLHAETERVRTSGGRTVRHRRPPEDVPLEEREEYADTLLRAPCASARELSARLQQVCRGNNPNPAETAERPDDLVAMIGRGHVVIGLSEASVRTVFQAIQESSSLSSLNQGTVAATIDLERLRHFPLLEGVLGGTGSSTSPWWSILRRLSVTVERTVGGIIASGSLSLAPPPSSAAPGAALSPQ